MYRYKVGMYGGAFDPLHIGDTVSDTMSASSGKCFSTRSLNAGQHEVVFFLPSALASIHSFASAMAVMSAPSPTSTAS